MALKTSFSYFTQYKPVLLMILVQIGFTFLYVISDASFNHGMNPHVFVTYRHIVAAIFMSPFAYFIERKARPKMTFALFMEMNLLGLLGVSATLNMFFASLKYTSPTFVAVFGNTIASLTFVIAVLVRLETVDLRQSRSVAKVVGTLVSLAGVTTMTLYKGPVLKNLWDPLIHYKTTTVIHERWLEGSILSCASCLCWAAWYIMQALTLKRYPAPLSLTAWMCFVGAVQSAIFTLIVEHRSAAWIIGFNVDFWSVVYGGLVISSGVYFVQLWCTEAKGPVFVTMFSPLSTVLTAVITYFILGEKLYLGSVIGAVIVIVGFYMLLWGKEADTKVSIKPNEQGCVASDEEKSQKTNTGRNQSR